MFQATTRPEICFSLRNSEGNAILKLNGTWNTNTLCKLQKGQFMVTQVDKLTY